MSLLDTIFESVLAAVAASWSEVSEREAQRQWAIQKDAAYRRDWLMRRSLGIAHVAEDLQ